MPTAGQKLLVKQHVRPQTAQNVQVGGYYRTFKPRGKSKKTKLAQATAAADRISRRIEAQDAADRISRRIAAQTAADRVSSKISAANPRRFF